MQAWWWTPSRAQARSRFCATDEAFAKIPKATLDGLLADKAALTKVLTYHVVPGKVMAKDVMAGKVKTVQGQELT